MQHINRLQQPLPRHTTLTILGVQVLLGNQQREQAARQAQNEAHTEVGCSSIWFGVTLLAVAGQCYSGHAGDVQTHDPWQLPLLAAAQKWCQPSGALLLQPGSQCLLVLAQTAVPFRAWQGWSPNDASSTSNSSTPCRLGSTVTVTVEHGAADTASPKTSSGQWQQECCQGLVLVAWLKSHAPLDTDAGVLLCISIVVRENWWSVVWAAGVRVSAYTYSHGCTREACAASVCATVELNSTGTALLAVDTFMVSTCTAQPILDTHFME